jgi:hypothetical protein
VDDALEQNASAGNAQAALSVIEQRNSNSLDGYVYGWSSEPSNIGQLTEKLTEVPGRYLADAISVYLASNLPTSYAPF